MKASPNKLPTARLTITKIIRFSLCSVIEIKAMPTSERRLTKTTLTKLYNHEAGVGFTYSLRKQITHDFFNRIRVCLSQISRTRGGNGALNSSFPKNLAVVRPDEFKISNDPDELPRIRLPTRDLADEYEA